MVFAVDPPLDPVIAVAGQCLDNLLGAELG
jgi:hypothetical protein